MLARKIVDSQIWRNKPSWWLKVWLYILIRVNHKDNAQFKRGTNFFNAGTIYYDCALYNENIKELTTRNVISYLRKANMITYRKTTRGVIITVVNYDQYQDFMAYKSQQESQQENQWNSQQKVNGKSTINNNDNNVISIYGSKNKKLKDKTPTKQMIAIFKDAFAKYREGKPKVDAGKDGSLCKKLWHECLATNSDKPMDVWRERCELLIKERDISSIGGISAFWNTAIPKKKDKEPWEIAKERTREMLRKEKQ